MLYKFKAVRIVTKGNLIFPDKIIINDIEKNIIYKKQNWYGIGHNEISIKFKDVVSVELITRIEWIFFCNVSIQTIGGGGIMGNGFLKEDANQIKTLLGY